MEASMRRRFTSIVLTAAAVLAAAGCSRRLTASDSSKSFTFAATEAKLVKVDIRSLDLEVTAVEGSEIHATVRLEARSSSSAVARRWVERNMPELTDSSTTLAVTQPRSSGAYLFAGFLHTAGRITLEVPRQCLLEVSTASGDIELDGRVAFASPVHIATSSGDVHVEGGANDLTVKTTSGDLTVEGAPLASLDVETNSGDVRVRSGSSRVLVDSTSGDVRLAALDGDASIDTSSGDVWATWDELASGHSIRIDTSSGKVSLRIPRETTGTGEIRTSSGRIRSDLEGDWDRRHHTLSLTGGGITFDVRTVSGDVSIRHHG
jgi:hypothetical protein